MIMNKIKRIKMKTLVMSVIFAFVNLFSLAAPVQNVYAEPDDGSLRSVLDNFAEEAAGKVETSSGSTQKNDTVTRKDLCREGFDNISWLLCPKTEKGAKAVDEIYDKIEAVLDINPISGDSGSIIMRIWDISRGITNIVFVILLLMVVLSQITGFGINNYGIKRILPKLIIAAIAVNISFYICSYAVDLSNILGMSIRNLFLGIESSVLGTTVETYSLSALGQGFGDYYDALAGLIGTGSVLATVTFETGAIFMLIPAVLVALVAVLSGFLTIALRQVVVVLCVMIAPLAIVAMIFPNTYNLFRKWRSTLTSMLVFYPMFSLLFGASSLAGFAVNNAAGDDGFMKLIGMIIQVAPLILCWKLMKMSGTVLGGVYGTVSGVLTGLFVNPARRYASSLAMHRRAHTLAQVNPYTPSARLMQYMENRRLSREMDIAEYSQYAKQRAAAFNANKKYKLTDDGRIKMVTKDGEEAYALQAGNMEFQRAILRDQNAMNQGLGTLGKDNKDFEYSDKDQESRLMALDNQNVRASDTLFSEQQHANDIAYRNAISRAERFDRAINAHIDDVHKNELGHRFHHENAPKRYEEMRGIMGSDEGAQYIAAAATSASESMKQIRQGQFQKYFDATVPTQDVVNRLKDLTTNMDAANNIDAIISGMRTLNKRGDGELLKASIDDLLSNEKIKLGTAASQTLANFLISEVKDSDPMLKRFGKYLNLETARYYNTDRVAEGSQRKRQHVDFDEYVLDGYDLRDDNGDLILGEDGKIKRDTVKRGMTQLLMGTSFKGVEREAYSNILKSIAKACGNNTELREQVNDAVYNAILPNIVGDQFNYQSGSEQIIGFTKTITGQKPVFKDNKIVGYEWDESTLKLLHPDLNKAKEIATKRTNTLLNAEVANQASKQKSDFIGAAGAVYRDMAEKAFLDKEHNQAYKEWREWEDDKIKNHQFVIDESRRNPDAKDPEDFEKNRFAHYQYMKQFKPSVMVAMAKQFKKGYAGDSKENTVEMIGFNDFKDDALMEFYSQKTKNASKEFKQDVVEQQKLMNPNYIPEEDDDDEDDDGPVPTSTTGINDPYYFYGSAADEGKNVYKNTGGSHADKHREVTDHMREIGLDSEHQAQLDFKQEGYDQMPFITDAEAEVDIKNDLK